MQFRSLEGLVLEDIVKVFNLAFADYFIPFHLNEAQLRSKRNAERINLALSVGAFEDQKLIAFILHGADLRSSTKLLYNAGTGVVPAKRGFGLSRKMYHYCLPFLREAGISKISLEVMSQNTKALKSYESIGFEHRRNLHCFRGDISVLPSNPEIRIQRLESLPWESISSFGDVRPSWQNERRCIDQKDEALVFLGAFLDEQLVAYAAFNSKLKRLHQIAVDVPFRRRGIASELLAWISLHLSSSMTVINLDEKAQGVLKFFRSIGLEHFMEQKEMELHL